MQIQRNGLTRRMEKRRREFCIIDFLHFSPCLVAQRHGLSLHPTEGPRHRRMQHGDLIDGLRRACWSAGGGTRSRLGIQARDLLTHTVALPRSHSPFCFCTLRHTPPNIGNTTDVHINETSVCHNPSVREISNFARLPPFLFWC